MAVTSPLAVQHVIIPSGEHAVHGALALPSSSRGIVIFAHGSGSSYPSNDTIARHLQDAGFGTLLVDLLTPEEAALNERTGQYRFDVATLASRVLAATIFVGALKETQLLPVAYFGSSTGAAAALTAAAERPDVFAVISRGGRADLAADCLPRLKAPTLLIVGGADVPMIPLNEQALAALVCEKELAIVPNASHLFEEPGALDTVARLTVDWLGRHLPRAAA
jgi:putative phosphoribosyl transferase